MKTENRVFRIFDLKGHKDPRNSEKGTRALKFVFITSIIQVDQTEKNWCMGHFKCKGKTRKIRKISMNFSLCETKM